jgi:hypothetical protein
VRVGQEIPGGDCGAVAALRGGGGDGPGKRARGLSESDARAGCGSWRTGGGVRWAGVRRGPGGSQWAWRGESEWLGRAGLGRGKGNGPPGLAGPAWREKEGLGWVFLGFGLALGFGLGLAFPFLFLFSDFLSPI